MTVVDDLYFRWILFKEQPGGTGEDLVVAFMGEDWWNDFWGKYRFYSEISDKTFHDIPP